MKILNTSIFFYIILQFSSCKITYMTSDSWEMKVDEHTFYFKRDTAKNNLKKSIRMYDNDFTLLLKPKKVNRKYITKSKIYNNDNKLIFSKKTKKRDYGFYSVQYYLKEKTFKDNYEKKIILREGFNLFKFKRVRKKKLLIDSMGVKLKSVYILPNLRYRQKSKQ